MALTEDKNWSPPVEDMIDHVDCPDFKEEEEIEIQKEMKVPTRWKRPPR